MTFAEAGNAILPFGKHQGESVDEAARTDDGLRYLDWLSGQNLYGKIREALDAYLSDPSIARELEQILGA